ncbi:unnamed protein product, partial [Didymodactylos carnosus]
MCSLRSIYDEEAELNRLPSQFKKELQHIFDAVHQQDYHVIKNEHLKQHDSNLKWLSYLLKNVLPTCAIWSSLLLGNLSRHKVQSAEKIILDKNIQRSTANSERRMGIVKKMELGGIVRERIDIVVRILIENMINNISSFAEVMLLKQSKSLEPFRTKPIQENWQQKPNRRNQGYYQQAATERALFWLNDDVTVVPSINIGFQFVDFYYYQDIYSWLTTTINLLLSLPYIRRVLKQYHQLQLNNLLNEILLITKMINGANIKSTNKINIGIHLFNDVLSSIPIDLKEHVNSNNLLNKIIPRVIVPITNKLVGSEVFCILTIRCTTCNNYSSRLTIYPSVVLSNINMADHLQEQLQNFFFSSMADINCKQCLANMEKQLFVLRWPTIILVHLQQKRNISSTRKPPSLIHLHQHSHPLNICSQSSSCYYLLSFISLTSSGKLVVSTRSNKHWKTTESSKSYGEGEYIQNLYGQ